MPHEPFEPRAESKLKQCMVWLTAALMAGPQPAATLEAEGLARGFSKSTMMHAREKLHVRSERQAKQWVWHPPRRVSALKK